MRGHRSERVGRKPFHCLSMRQRRRIREEIKLIQESVEAEIKRNQNSKEGESFAAQTHQSAGNGIPQQGNTTGSIPSEVYVPGSTNSCSSSQEVLDPLLPGSALPGTYSYPMHFLPGPSGYLGTITANRMPSVPFKLDSLMPNHQQPALSVGKQTHTAVFEQDRNGQILDQLK